MAINKTDNKTAADNLSMPPSNNKKRVGLITAGIITLALAGFLALAGGQGFKILQKFGGAGGARLAWQGITHPRNQFPGKDRLNILLIGEDNNTDRKGMQFSGKGSRSDTLMFLSLDLENKKMNGISVPRDTYIPERHGKINAAFAQGGAPMAMKTVAGVLGVVPDHYIVLRSDAVKQIVNLLGGVEVEVKDHMKHDDYWGHLHIDLPAGRYVVNGEQAVGFVRFREANIYQYQPNGLPVLDRDKNPVKLKHIEHSLEEGDDRRMARQQQLIRAMAKKAKEPAILWRADSLLDDALKVVSTDLTRTQMLALATLFRDTQPEQIQTVTLPGKGIFVGRHRMWAMELDKRRTKAAVDWLVKGDEEAANRLTLVQVKNRTDVRGAATNMVDFLKDKGFDARLASEDEPTDSPMASSANAATTQIVYGKAFVAARAQKVAQLIGGGIVTKEVVSPVLAAKAAAGKRKPTVSDDAADITVLIGKDLAASHFSQRSASR